MFSVQQPPPTFSDFTFGAPAPSIPAPVVATPTVLIFDHPWDETTGFLCNNFPSPFVGVTSGVSYFSVQQYLATNIAGAAGQEDLVKEIQDVQCQPFGNGGFDWQAIHAASTAIDLIQTKLKLTPSAELVETIKNSVYRALFYKFSQNDVLATMLVGTGDAILIYAITDAFFGVGVLRSGLEYIQKEQVGLNYVGRALMEIRDLFKTRPREFFDGHRKVQFPNKPSGEFLPVTTPIPMEPAPTVPQVEETVPVDIMAMFAETPVAEAVVPEPSENPVENVQPEQPQPDVLPETGDSAAQKDSLYDLFAQ